MRYHLAQLKAMAEEAQTSVFRVTANCEAEVEMLTGALEMSNRYPEPRIG